MWSLQELQKCLFELGTQDYQNIFIHSNLGFLGKSSDGKPDDVFLDLFENDICASSNIFLPAFTYSFGKHERFDPSMLISPNEMGSLSANAQKRGYFRSNDPMFSVLGIGPSASEFLKLTANCSFGPESTFGKLLNSKTALLLVSVGGGSTIVHEIERRLRVPYRFDKYFSGEMLIDGRTTKVDNWQSYVRNLEIEGSEADFRYLTKFLHSRKKLKTQTLGAGFCSLIGVDELKLEIEDLLTLTPVGLTKLGALQ